MTSVSSVSACFAGVISRAGSVATRRAQASSLFGLPARSAKIDVADEQALALLRESRNLGSNVSLVEGLQRILGARQVLERARERFVAQ